MKVSSIQVPKIIRKGDNIFTTAELLEGVEGSVKMVSLGMTVNGSARSYIQLRYAGPNYSSGPSDFVSPRKAKVLQENLNTNLLLNYPPHAPYMSAQDTQHLTNIHQGSSSTSSDIYTMLDIKYYKLETYVAPLVPPSPITQEDEGSDSSCVEAPDVLVVHLDGSKHGGDSGLTP